MHEIGRAEGEACQEHQEVRGAAKLMEDENANVVKARQELESLTFRDPDSQVGNLSNTEYCQGGSTPLRTSWNSRTCWRG